MVPLCSSACTRRVVVAGFRFLGRSPSGGGDAARGGAVPAPPVAGGRGRAPVGQQSGEFVGGTAQRGEVVHQVVAVRGVLVLHQGERAGRPLAAEDRDGQRARGGVVLPLGDGVALLDGLVEEGLHLALVERREVGVAGRGPAGQQGAPLGGVQEGEVGAG